MELSIENPDDTFNIFLKEKNDTLCLPSTSCQSAWENDTIDLSGFHFRDDESWLQDTRKTTSNLQKWLYDPAFADPKSAPKNIDTRTFTRPKKRFIRPSIEKYNEELYGSGELKELSDSGIQLNGCSQDDPQQKPLHFDLAQTTSSVYFDNILANAPMMDSFTNMSPPSLVNSMCSSTFANLMESSFIKNDPELREIRDTDFTVSILQQEAEPMFHSITESFSSLNSDVPENFLKKVSFTEGGEEVDTTVVLNATFAKEDDPCDRTITIDNCDEDFQDAKATNPEDLNSTYQRSTKPALNSTFQRRKSNKLSVINQEKTRPDLDATITIEPEKIFENTKRLLDRRPSPSLDLNRLSYVVEKNDQMHATFTTESPKRNSLGSTDSGENLDYMSLSSGSSKNSNIQSVDAINVIVDAQLRDLQQVMSTPKPRSRTPVLWPTHEISPINDRNSDPELSSNEAVIPQNSIRKQKSVGHIYQKIPNFKSVNTLGQFETKSTIIRGSHPNLKLAEPKTYSPQPKSSNLHSMGRTLKGSYTSLKPTNPNLPVAPPPLDTTTVVKKTAVAQVSPVLRETPKSQDAQFVKPQAPRSGLPRPVSTGIPRPMSRIPGPRNIRPVSKSAGQQGRY